MAEDRESSDRKHEKSKKRDRPASKVDPKVWTETEKMQLAEAIDMYGVSDVKRLAERIPTKKQQQVAQMLRDMRTLNRKEIECGDMKQLTFVDLNAMDDLFVAGGTRPREVMVKWMDYLEEFYGRDPFRYDKFKLFSQAFLVMSECTPPSTAIMRASTTTASANGVNPTVDDCIDFRKVYYYLYRIFNNFCTSRNHQDPVMKKYLYETFMRVLEDLEYTSDDEKIAMHNIVSNWTSVNRLKSLKVYGKVPKIEPGIKNETNTANASAEPLYLKRENNEDVHSNLNNAVFNVLEKPMIPSFNPLRMKSCHMRMEQNSPSM